MTNSHDTSDPQRPPEAGGPDARASQRSVFRAHLPRLEFAILFIGLAAIAFGKLSRLGPAKAGNLFVTTIVILPNDIAAVAFLMAAMYFAYALCPSRWLARGAVLLSFIVGAWAILNMVWLRMTGVQMHVEVLREFLTNFEEVGPIVTNNMSRKILFTTALATLALSAIVGLGLRLWKPQALRLTRRQYARRGITAAGIGFACVTFAFASLPWIEAVPGRGALSYNCHWFAVQSLLAGNEPSDYSGFERVVPTPRTGDRALNYPASEAKRPHVVLLILESAAYWATSFGEQSPEQTPTLTKLAAEGVFFDLTRAVVPRTTQSQFAMLTGGYPSLTGGYVESVVVDKPYESLTTILGRQGYRSRFSQMSRARFDCVPGLAANLGFDSFWGRENSLDPSSHLGYLAGDDMRMIGPAFEWFDRQEGPCLMVFMTSISHDPYELPSWYGPTPHDRTAAFLETVRFTDGFVKAVDEQLARRTKPEDVLLCVISDHGEGVGRHGVTFRAADPYEEALRIPWILRWPGTIQPGRVVSKPTSVMDVTPTILSLLGIDVSQAGFDGMNALSADLPIRRLAFFGWHRTYPAGFVDGNIKSVYWPAFDQAYRFDLASDPHEAHPTVLGEDETRELRDEIASMRHDYAIRFDPKRFRQRILFNDYLTSSMGNKAWCYFVPEDEGTIDE